MPANHSKHLIEPGDRFNRLKVVSFSHNDKRWRRHYVVQCDCGNAKTVQGTLLRSGNTRSCGCLAKEARAKTRLPAERGVINQIILQYKRHALERSLSFSLDYQTVERLVRGHCYYCGVIGGNLKKTKNMKEGFSYNGIDRLDSGLGYHDSNVVPCCGLCNRVKRDMPRETFLSWVKRVSDHQNAMAAQWSDCLKG
jgi:hypothetical protein